jgi:hypothetical protein
VVGGLIGWFSKHWLERRERQQHYASGRSTTYSKLKAAIALYQSGLEIPRAQVQYIEMWHVVETHPTTRATKLVMSLTSDVAVAARKIEAGEVTMDELREAIDEDIGRQKRRYPWRR